MSANKIQIDLSSANCLADRVLLYMRYVIDSLPISNDKTKELAMHIYEDHVRGEIITNPRTIAAQILYHSGAMICDDKNVTQQNIAEVLNTGTHTLEKQSGLRWFQVRYGLTKEDDWESTHDIADCCKKIIMPYLTLHRLTVPHA